MKSFYLFDTNIISEIRKPSPNPNVVKLFMEKKDFADISSITWAESLAGLKRMPEGKKKEALSAYYNEIIHEQFDIVPFDEHAACVYSDLYPRLEEIGKIPQDFDLQIASIAIANNMILVTRNTKDFEHIGITTRNFWRVVNHNIYEDAYADIFTMMFDTNASKVLKDFFPNSYNKIKKQVFYGVGGML